MIRAGTSGYNYDAWKGRFYPDKLPASKMLGFYAGRFSTVEINYTFRRMPTQKALAAWAAQVPENFSFALKAPFWIVNQKRTAASLRALKPFLEVTSLLGKQRGPILFQLPAGLKLDLPRLQSFLAALPQGVMAAFEFLDPSWQDDAVHQALAGADAALCITEDSETSNGGSKFRTAVQKTASWGYLRLRRLDYDQRALRRWRKRLEELRFQGDVFVYFKHEDTGSGPRFAELLAAP